MRSLRRPMFRRGGKVSSRNNGIVSGFASGGSVRQGYAKMTPRGVVPDDEETQIDTSQQNTPLSYTKAVPNYLTFKPEDADAAFESGLGPAEAMPKGLTTSDYLRIASMGAEIMGAPNVGGSGLMGALKSASPALSSAGKDLSETFDERKALYDQKQYARKLGIAEQRAESVRDRNKINLELTNAQNLREANRVALENQQAAEYEMLKYTDENKMARLKYEIDNKTFEFTEKMKAFRELSAEVGTLELALVEAKNSGNKELINELQNKIRVKQQELQVPLEGTVGQKAVVEVIKGIPRELYQQWFTTSKRGVDEKGQYEPGSADYYDAIQLEVQGFAGSYISGLIDAVKGEVDDIYSPNQGFAKGGRVGLQGGGDPMLEQMPGPGATQTTTMEQQQSPQLTFGELRKRLPPEVTDKVITLLTQSQEALLDFTRIQVPADINKFNQKYGTDLTLPTQVA